MIIHIKLTKNKKSLTGFMEYLQYTTYVNPKVNKDYYVVLEFKTYNNPSTPYLLVRNIKTGEEFKTKITAGKIFKESTFCQFSILIIYDFRDQFKKKKIGEEWGFNWRNRKNNNCIWMYQIRGGFKWWIVVK